MSQMQPELDRRCSHWPIVFIILVLHGQDRHSLMEVCWIRKQTRSIEDSNSIESERIDCLFVPCEVGCGSDTCWLSRAQATSSQFGLCTASQHLIDPLDMWLHVMMSSRVRESHLRAADDLKAARCHKLYYVDQIHCTHLNKTLRTVSRTTKAC